MLFKLRSEDGINSLNFLKNVPPLLFFSRNRKLKKKQSQKMNTADTTTSKTEAAGQVLISVTWSHSRNQPVSFSKHKNVKKFANSADYWWSLKIYWKCFFWSIDGGNNLFWRWWTVHESHDEFIVTCAQRLTDFVFLLTPFLSVQLCSDDSLIFLRSDVLLSGKTTFKTAENCCDTGWNIQTF